MREINYSIIIPHKNIPDLLQRCLDSLPRREDIQIIVVDDNSDFEKVDFKHFPGINDPYVEIYLTKEGRGAGYARNVGLEHANGKWLLFADADDFFLEGIETFLNKNIDSPYEIIYFGVLSVYSDTLLPSDRGDFVNRIIQTAIDTKNMDVLKYQRLEPWGKIIAKELVDKFQIRFDETIAANDLMFSILSAYHASTITVSRQPLYCLTARYGSLAYTIQKNVCDAKFFTILKVNTFLCNIGKKQYRINIFPYVLKYRYIACYLFYKRLWYLFFNDCFLLLWKEFFMSVGHFVFHRRVKSKHKMERVVN